jgi:DNA-binding transcriptional regulator YhcF (GntR family)
MLEEEKKRAEDDKKVMQETLEKTVKTMLQHGIDCDTIAGVTKLPLDEVKRIKG